MTDYDLLGAKWGARALGAPGGQVTWSFAETFGVFYSFDAIIAAPAFQVLVREAFAAWERVADIDFVEIADGAETDIRLGWDTIDGAGAVIGQAQFTYNIGAYNQMIRSEVRFDSAEHWSTDRTGSDGLANFYAVAVHEIGHAIGLGHSGDTDSIMYPVLQHQDALTADDMAGARALYGPAAATNQSIMASYSGTSGADDYRGSASADVMSGGAGQDRFEGLGGNDLIDGGAGRDHAVFGGRLSDYLVTWSQTEALVEDRRSGSPDGSDRLVDVERLVFADGTLALDIDGVAGQAYRLYQAAFARTPDEGGLGYWIDQLDAGRSLHEAGDGFIGSAEFRALYSAVSGSDGFVARLYDNILGRAGEAEGIRFWADALDSGQSDKATILIGFSESAENRAGLATVLDDGIWYT
jgi:hypothetical protein